MAGWELGTWGDWGGETPLQPPRSSSPPCQLCSPASFFPTLARIFPDSLHLFLEMTLPLSSPLPLQSPHNPPSSQAGLDKKAQTTGHLQRSPNWVTPRQPLLYRVGKR